MSPGLGNRMAAPRRRPAAAISGASRAGRGRVNPPGRGMMNPPGMDRGVPGRGVGAQGKGQGATKGKGVGVGGARPLPSRSERQLASRISSGAITQEQADRTLQQRQTLKKAFGSDWRRKLSVGGQSFRDVNQGLVKNPGDPRLAALRKKLLTNRETLLEAARKKSEAAGSSTGEGGA